MTDLDLLYNSSSTRTVLAEPVSAEQGTTTGPKIFGVSRKDSPPEFPVLAGERARPGGAGTAEKDGSYDGSSIQDSASSGGLFRLDAARRSSHAGHSSGNRLISEQSSWQRTTFRPCCDEAARRWRASGAFDARPGPGKLKADDEVLTTLGGALAPD